MLCLALQTSEEAEALVSLLIMHMMDVKFKVSGSAMFRQCAAKLKGEMPVPTGRWTCV